MTKSVGMAWAMGVVLLLTMAGGAPSAGPVTVAQERTEPAASIAGDARRGQYIVEHVAMCGECHSSRDAQGTILEDTRFLGGPMPPAPSWAADWATRAPRNAGLPGYTDAQAERLLREGAIGRRGVQLRPPMPRFRMTAQDAADVIAYMRSVPR
ncbi:MAG: cytochrome c [Acidobacteriota bacterium]|nr:cytochrome c [Acidobacteriota bacterium]